MSIANVLAEAPLRGIHVALDGDNVAVEGEDEAAVIKFGEWVGRHKAEVVAELRKPNVDIEVVDDAEATETEDGEFVFTEPQPNPADYTIGDGSNRYLKAFLEWARRRRAAKRQWESRRQPRVLPAKSDTTVLDAFLNEARAGTHFTLAECKSGLLFSPHDLELIAVGDMTLAAAKHFLEHKDKAVCPVCLGGGCSQCDYFGDDPATETGNDTDADDADDDDVALQLLLLLTNECRANLAAGGYDPANARVLLTDWRAATDLDPTRFFATRERLKNAGLVTVLSKHAWPTR